MLTIIDLITFELKENGLKLVFLQHIVLQKKLYNHTMADWKNVLFEKNILDHRLTLKEIAIT